MGLFKRKKQKLDNKGRKQGTNCRKYNLNKYNPKGLATEGCQVLSSGAIVFRTIQISPRKNVVR